MSTVRHSGGWAGPRRVHVVKHLGVRLLWEPGWIGRANAKRPVLNDDELLVKSHQRTCVPSPLAIMAKAIAAATVPKRNA
jgi:hypothetical protein